MSGSDNIFMDYTKMFKSAGEIEDLANRLEGICKSKMEGMYYKQQWNGDSGDEFRLKVKKVDAKLKARAEDLRSTARAMRRAAEILQSVEQATIERIMS